jgi:protein TonB
MFETTLLESNRKRLARKSRWYVSGPLALAFHGLAVGAIVFTGLWHIEPVADPPVKVGPFAGWTPIVSLPVAVPHWQKRAEPKTEPQKGESQPSPEVVQPKELPPELPPGTGAPEEWQVDNGRGGEWIPGLPPGLPDSGGRPGLPGPPAEQAGEPVHLTAAMTRPVPFQQVAPVYPEMARKAGLGGKVELEAIIASSGSVEDVRVTRSAGAILDQAAIEAVLQWQYRPATLNGVPIKVYLSVTVVFQLK